MFSKSTVLVYVLFSYYCYGNEVYCGRFMMSFDSLLYHRVLIGQVMKPLLTRGGILSCASRMLVSYFLLINQMSESDHGVCKLNGGKEGKQETIKERAESSLKYL